MTWFFMKKFLLETRRYTSSLILWIVYLTCDWDAEQLAVFPTVVASFSEMSACSWVFVNACFFLIFFFLVLKFRYFCILWIYMSWVWKLPPFSVYFLNQSGPCLFEQSWFWKISYVIFATLPWHLKNVASHCRPEVSQ